MGHTGASSIPARHFDYRQQSTLLFKFNTIYKLELKNKKEVPMKNNNRSVFINKLRLIFKLKLPIAALVGYLLGAPLAKAYISFL